MSKQLIISIGREYGSGGHEIAMKIAEKYGLPLYDHSILDQIAKDRGLDVKVLEEYDEKKRNMFLTRTVRGMTNSPEHSVANLQFDFLRDKAAAGESFVVVGRCVNGTDISKYTEKEMQKLRGKLFAMVFQDPMTALNPTSQAAGHRSPHTRSVSRLLRENPAA